MVKYDPTNRAFSLNSSHAFVVAQMDNPRSKKLLEDIAMAEVLLETQLRLAGISAQIVGDVLEERNKLLVGLALEHPYSHKATAQLLRDSTADQHDLEIALVAAARGLGFVAKHVSGSGEADGVARFVSYPERQTKIILEAKSSGAVPSLSALDFAGLQEHMLHGVGKGSEGCLLIAPSYPATLDDNSATAHRANSLKVSCWTIEQLACVLEAAEARHITAKEILAIVQNAFAPLDVIKAVQDLFATPAWDQSELGDEIIKALESLENRLSESPRTLAHVAASISLNPSFCGIGESDIKIAATALAAASKGALIFDGGTFTRLTSYDELRRRSATSILGEGTPLRAGNLKANLKPGAIHEH